MTLLQKVQANHIPPSAPTVHLNSAASKQMPPSAMFMKVSPREETLQWAMVTQFIAGYPQNTLALKRY